MREKLQAKREGGDMFLSANQVEASLREDAQVYMILASMRVETKTPVSDIPLVRVSRGV